MSVTVLDKKKSFLTDIPFNYSYDEFRRCVDDNINSLKSVDDYGKYASCYVSKYGGGDPRQRVVYLIWKDCPITVDTAIEFLFAGMLRFSRLKSITFEFINFIKFFYKIPIEYNFNISSVISSFMSNQIRDWYSYDMIFDIQFLMDIKDGYCRDFIRNVKRFLPTRERVEKSSYICYFNDDGRKLDNFLLLLEYSLYFFIENDCLDEENCFYIFYNLKRNMPKMSKTFELVDPRFVDTNLLNKNLEIVKNYLLNSGRYSLEMKRIILKL